MESPEVSAESLQIEEESVKELEGRQARDCQPEGRHDAAPIRVDDHCAYEEQCDANVMSTAVSSRCATVRSS